MMPPMTTLDSLLQEIRACRRCEPHLPEGPRPVVVVNDRARILIIGQAPGRKVHASGIPWDDPSGERLRSWLQMDRQQFYGDPRLSIMPMGFCYPGKGRSGDLPPRPECAPAWHEALLQEMPALSLILLIGQYAQKYYAERLGVGTRGASLAERLRAQPLDRLGFCLPHPSPRNIRWFKSNPWFERETLPALRSRIGSALSGTE